MQEASERVVRRLPVELADLEDIPHDSTKPIPSPRTRYNVLGAGGSAAVYEPKENRSGSVVRVGMDRSDSPSYHLYASAVEGSDNPYHPKIHSHRVMKQGGDGKTMMTVTRMEKLKPLSEVPNRELDSIHQKLFGEEMGASGLQGYHALTRKIKSHVSGGNTSNDPHFNEAMKGIRDIVEKHGKFNDIVTDNVMARQRDDGTHQLVITDPIA